MDFHEVIIITLVLSLSLVLMFSHVQPNSCITHATYIHIEENECAETTSFEEVVQMSLPRNIPGVKS